MIVPGEDQVFPPKRWFAMVRHRPRHWKQACIFYRRLLLDEAGQFRFVTHAHEEAPAVPILLVRALGTPLSLIDETNITTGYATLGVDLPEALNRLGVENGRRPFREMVLQRLSGL